MRMPRFIEPDKANHRVRGAEVSGACAALAVIGCALLVTRSPAALLVYALVAAAASAPLAGFAVERWQARQNARAGYQLHQIERADIVATARGAAPIVVLLVVLLIFTGANL